MKATVLETGRADRLVRPTTQAPGTALPVASPRTLRMLHAPVLVTLIGLAAPNIVVVVVQSLSSAVDAFYLGRLGPTVLAGIALVFPVWMLMVTTSAGALGGGISSSVARALGASRHADASRLVAHGLVISTLAGVAFCLAVVTGGPLLYRAIGGGSSGPVLEAALAYSGVVFVGGLFVWLVNGIASVLRGSGEMFVPACVVVGGECFHMAFAPVLIFGLGPFPALGVEGGALSLVTSYALRALVLAAYLLSPRALVKPPRRALTDLRRHFFWDILRVGLPGSVNTLISNLNVMAVTSLIASSGVIALAAYGLAARLQYLLIPLVFGLGTALVTMVGTNIGANDIRRARRVAWTGAGLAATATGAIGLVVALVPSAWLGLFTSDPAVLAVGSVYLRIVGPTYALFGLGLALYFAAQGAGHLAPALVAGFVSLLISVGGGYFVLNVVHAELPWLFGVIAVAYVVFGVIQAAAISRVIRNPR
jgi:putative MATE family efflux protein